MMGNYLDKWKTLFPEVVGGTKRPLEAISDQDEFNTNGFPQFIAQDPVRYDLQNAFLKQFLSNDAWLWVRQQQAYQALDRHKDDAQAHPNGVSGNAASATKLQTARSLNLGGAVTADAATFDGTADTTINVKTLDATKLKGTASVSTTGNAATATKLQTARTLSLTGKAAGSTTFDGSANASINVTSVNADTASKLSTARKINITGNATGAATFDGTNDVSINVSVSQAAHADRATADANGNELANAQRYMHVYDLPNNTDFNNVKTTGIYTCTQDSYTNRPASSWGVLRVYWFSDNVKQEYVPDNRYEVYERYFTGGKWNAWSKVNAANADTATKLATPRAISLTGNASGSANFDGSGNVSINTTVNESKHAAAADSATTATKVNATAPNGGTADLAFGTMAVNDYARVRVGGSEDNGWLEIATADGGNEPIYVRQYSGPYDWPNGRPGTVKNEAALLDGNGNTKFPHNVTAANFVGHLTGNADSATNADKVDGVHAASLFYDKGIWDANNWATIGTYQVNGNPPVSGAYQWGQVISSSTAGARFQLYASHTFGGTGRLYYKTGYGDDKSQPWNTILDSENYNRFAPTKTGGGASGTWGINISGNAASATNADKVDGYHASDLLRTLGGNRTPVITDIFDRAGTIDMSTMSEADKATHKANINKAPNMIQNLWNGACGIYAYGGDTDINGYYRGTLKLTQSYKNFDKLMIIFTDDKAGWELVRMFDVYEFNYYMTSLHSFNLLENNLFWYIYGLTKHGTDADFKPSTETILSCRSQNCGIIGIYGIKY